MRSGVLACLAVTLAACQTPLGDALFCQPALRPVDELGPARELRARVRVERGGDVAHLELSIEKRDDELVMVARNEMGAIAFALVQRGSAAEIVRSLPRSLLPLPPVALLADVQAVFFRSEVGERQRSSTRCGYSAHFSLVGETFP